jgi:hypothetical protein
MTKAKALKLMGEYSRDVVEPSFAQKITKAFGFSLSDLGVASKKISEFPIMHTEEVRNLKGVAMYGVARALVYKLTGITLYSNMNGRGSAADDIVSKAIDVLSHYQIAKDNYNAPNDTLGFKMINER